MNILPAIKNTASRETTTANDPPEEKGAGASKAADPEYTDRTVFRRVNHSRRVWFENGRAVEIVDGELAEVEFDSDPMETLHKFRTERERVTTELRFAAMRYVAQIEPRSLQEIADEYGVTKAAVSAICRDVLARLGCRQILDNCEKRRRIAEAVKRYHNGKAAA